MNKYVVIGEIIFGALMLICIISLIISSNQQSHETQLKKDFCKSINLTFRNEHCGFGCWQDQCFSQEGKWELAGENGGYTLIGYKK